MKFKTIFIGFAILENFSITIDEMTILLEFDDPKP